MRLAIPVATLVAMTLTCTHIQSARAFHGRLCAKHYGYAGFQSYGYLPMAGGYPSNMRMSSCGYGACGMGGYGACGLADCGAGACYGGAGACYGGGMGGRGFGKHGGKHGGCGFLSRLCRGGGLGGGLGLGYGCGSCSSGGCGGYGDGCGNGCGGGCASGGCASGGCAGGGCAGGGCATGGEPMGTPVPAYSNPIPDGSMPPMPPSPVIDTQTSSGRGPFRLTGLREVSNGSFERGLTRYRSGVMSEALNEFESAANAEPDNALVQYYRALAIYNLYGADAAQHALDQAVATESNHPVANWGKQMERVQGQSRLWIEKSRRSAGIAR